MSIVLRSLESGLGWRPSNILVWLFSLVGTKNKQRNAREFDMFFRNSAAKMEMLFLGTYTVPLRHLGNMDFHSFMVFFLYMHSAYMHFKKCAKKKKNSLPLLKKQTVESIWTKGNKNKNSNRTWCVFLLYFCPVWGLFSALINRKMMTHNRLLDTGWLWAVLLS